MKDFQRNTGLEFDDVLIKPIPSSVNSRDDVDITTTIGSLTLKFPVMASPMVGVTDSKVLIKLSDLGGVGFVHRFYKDNKKLNNELKLLRGYNYGIAIPLYKDIASVEFILNEYNPKILLVDIANGYLTSLYKYCERLKKLISSNNLDTLLMSGNVVDNTGVENLYYSGCDLIRFGIGSGNNCSTRNVTGISIPTISALLDVDVKYRNNIVVDGGIRYSGDYVKSIVAGANFCMSGKLFAQAFEAPNRGSLYGMASRFHQNNMNYSIKSVEGFNTKIKKKYFLRDFVSEFSYGVKSAGTYLNSRSIDDIYNNGEFNLTSRTSIKDL